MTYFGDVILASILLQPDGFQGQVKPSLIDDSTRLLCTPPVDISLHHLSF